MKQNAGESFFSVFTKNGRKNAEFETIVGEAEMETGQVDRHRSGRPAGRVAGRVEILRPACQAG